ncbi:MAG: uroporphyrinogen-III C-methyltransferase [Enterovibrio sp.]
MSGSNKQSGEQSNATSNEQADTANAQAPLEQQPTSQVSEPTTEAVKEPETKAASEPETEVAAVPEAKASQKPASTDLDHHARVTQAEKPSPIPKPKSLHKSEAEHKAAPQSEHKESHSNTNSKDAKESCASDKKCKKGGTGLSLLAIAMVAGLGGFIFAYAHPKIALQLEQMTTLQDEINTLRGELVAQAQRHSTQLTKLQEEAKFALQQSDNSISSLQKTLLELKGRRPNDWLLAEADFLVKRAGRQIWFEQDTVTAIRLLETADQRISELNDPSLTPIRQAIASDIQELKSVVRVDADGIVLKLTSLQLRVDKLPLSHVLVAQEQEEKAEPPQVSNNVDNWKENLRASLLNFIDQFITYRRRDGNAVPLLTTAQTFYLQENLKAKLAQAINAVYRENSDLYGQALGVSQQWLHRFYNVETPEVQSFLAAVQELEQQTIKVEYPSQLASQTILQDELSRRLQRDLGLSAATGERQ